jgi:tRNA 2-thiouridine synthesizing protein A
MRAAQQIVTGADGGTMVRFLDLEGLPSAVALAWAGVTMVQLRPGELLVVRTTDPGSVRDFGVWCRATGNELLQRSEQTGRRGIHRFVFVIRRRAARAQGGAGNGVASWRHAPPTASWAVDHSRR